jgi:cell division protein FtsB
VSPRVLAGVIGVVGLGLVLYAGNGLLRVWRMQQQVEALEREIASLRGRTHDLAQAVDRLRNDPATIEKIAREERGFVREGERVLKFPSTPGGR